MNTKHVSALLSILLLIILAAAQTSVMPACLSTCMTSFPGSHEPDTCDATWTSSITSCINASCSTTLASSPSTNYANTTVTFVPKLQYSCQQSLVQGLSNSPQAPSLMLQNGVCNQSPYGFLSFTATYANLDLLACVLLLYDESGCAGATSTVDFGSEPLTGVVSGECAFGNGSSVMLECKYGVGQNITDNEAAHEYLDSICRTTATSSASATAATTTTNLASLAMAYLNSTVVVSATTSIRSPVVTATGNFTAPRILGLSSPSGSSNATVTSAVTSTVLRPTMTTSRIDPYTSKAGEKSVEGNEAARWALVVAVLAGSLTF